MKVFSQREMMEAVLFSMSGGQAIHLHTFNQGHPLFKRYPVIAHLFDRDETRLIDTAYRLGVRVIKVERKGEQAQHIDLCGKPFIKACNEATEHTLAVDNCPECNGYKVIANHLRKSVKTCPACKGSGLATKA